MQVIIGKELKKYFMSHVEKTDKPGFYLVHTPLKVFKKLGNNVIASLIIPPGAAIYAGEIYWHSPHENYHKMRASCAYVEQIATQALERIVSEGASLRDRSFKYVSGDMVFPREEFSAKDYQCDSGIHFFLNLGHAKKY